MQATVSQYLEGIDNSELRRAVSVPLSQIGDCLSSQSLVSGALRISGGSASPLAQTNATYYGLANGKLVKVASATNMPSLFGTVTNAFFNVFVFAINSAGTVTTLTGAQASTLGGVVFPQMQDQSTPIGYLIVNPTGTGNFVGGTTNLDDATVVPNAVFINTLGAVDPTVLI